MMSARRAAAAPFTPFSAVLCEEPALKPTPLELSGIAMRKPVRKAVLPVAGLGTRFLPATKAIPKEMLTVVDRPVVQHVVDEARAAGSSISYSSPGATRA